METLEKPAPPFATTAPDGYASVAEMLSWAKRTIYRRDPDVVITSPSNPVDYLRRWWIVPRNAFANVYLHEFLRSDDDRALHDHPWENTSWLLEGEYLEHTPEGVFHRRPGDFVSRPAGALHRIELIDFQPVISLFTTGPKVRDWGFACPQGWVPWQQFTAPGNAGCGE